MYKTIEQVSQCTKNFQHVKNNTRNIRFDHSRLGQLICKCGVVCVSSLTIISSKLQENVNKAVTRLLLQATTERFQEA